MIVLDNGLLMETNFLSQFIQKLPESSHIIKSLCNTGATKVEEFHYPKHTLHLMIEKSNVQLHNNNACPLLVLHQPSQFVVESFVK